MLIFLFITCRVVHNIKSRVKISAALLKVGVFFLIYNVTIFYKKKKYPISRLVNERLLQWSNGSQYFTANKIFEISKALYCVINSNLQVQNTSIIYKYNKQNRKL